MEKKSRETEVLDILARNNQKESRETLVQFGEHKPIRRVGRLRCFISSTEQSEEESGDFGAIWRAQTN